MGKRYTKDEHYNTDDQFEIRMCLNCEKAECTNCLQTAKDKGLKIADPEKVQERIVKGIEDLVDPPVPRIALTSDSPMYYSVFQCYINGFNDDEISEILNISDGWVKKMRRKMKLHSFRKQEKLLRRARFEQNG